MENKHFRNELAKEKSPYLQAHSTDPINWLPWNSHSISIAKSQDIPIFLSIGYTACHWCHMMKRECFENLEIARILNNSFVPILVDREEHIYIDDLYMDLSHLLIQGQVGWPLNLVLTPELKPFFGTTYLPAASEGAGFGLMEHLLEIEAMWLNPVMKEDLVRRSEEIFNIVEKLHTYTSSEPPQKDDIQSAAEYYYAVMDPTWGGMNGYPKFPLPFHTQFLIDYYLSSGDKRAFFLAEKTLIMMGRGGIYDHIEGGFCRYSMDQFWMIPHFEKMLHDNAAIIETYYKAWSVNRSLRFKSIFEQSIQYLTTYMRGDSGEFYSAIDSDIDYQEGAHYLWSENEIKDVLGSDFDLMSQYWGISEEGNYKNKNILHRPIGNDEFLQNNKMDRESLEAIENRSREKLKEHIIARGIPNIDQKCIAGWNAMLVHALATIGVVEDKANYLDIAEKCAKHLRNELWDGTILYHRWIEGEAKILGVLKDYAFMARACIKLFQCGRGSDWLALAIELVNVIKQRFYNEEGGYYQTDKGCNDAVIRKANFLDASEPSGNAALVEVLHMLTQITGEASYQKEIKRILSYASTSLKTKPFEHSFMLSVLIKVYATNQMKLVFVYDEDQDLDDLQKHLKLAHSLNRVDLTIVPLSQKDCMSANWAQFYGQKQDNLTCYLCKGNVCMSPVTGFAAIQELIADLG